jgi:flagellar hook protein FlgE
MGIFGMMQTSISGMSAQSDRLGTISDNIANSKTVGYKSASMEFETLVLTSGVAAYEPGAVLPHARYAISKQGAFNYTTSATDLAVKGQGFFVVSDADGQQFLTRAGSFVKDSQGDLINTAGYKLMGYPADGGTLQVVNVTDLTLQAEASTEGSIVVNLPSSATAIPGTSTPASANDATATYTNKTSVVVYGDQGEQITLDVYMTKTAADTWDLAIYNSADAPATGGFPYTAAPLSTSTLTFDSASGMLTGGSPVSVPVSSGVPITLDFDSSTQLYTGFAVQSTSFDGHGAAAVESTEITSKGELYMVYSTGEKVKAYDIPLGQVVSPELLTPLTGNIYLANKNSGAIQLGVPGSGGLGVVESRALEQSNVDISTELTQMIEAQRHYTANSKVFQAGAELSDTLINLMR